MGGGTDCGHWSWRYSVTASEMNGNSFSGVSDFFKRNDLQEGRVFATLYALSSSGEVAQLVRAPDCRSGGRGFEPRPSRHFQCEITLLSCCWNRAAQLVPRGSFSFGVFEDERSTGIEAR